MHPNQIFRGADEARNIAFARQRAFGVLAINAEDGPHLSHIPFLLSDDARSADLHLVRSNPIARMGEGPHNAKIRCPDQIAMSRPTGTACKIRCPHGTMSRCI